jgi:hypothetical protein
MLSENELLHHLQLWSFEHSVGTDQPHYIQARSKHADP